MTTATCSAGHASTATDYCDVCGTPIAEAVPAAGAAAPGPTSVPGPPPVPGAATGSLDLDPAAVPTVATPVGRTCPHCSTDNPSTALYCENCGYDFTTGQLPRPLDPPLGVPAATPGAVTPGTVTPGTPVPAGGPGPVEWVAEVWIDPDWYASQEVSDPCPSAGMPVVVPILERSVLVGRTSVSRNIRPQIDVSSDNGISRRHAQLTSDGQRWWVEDLASANGTFIGAAGAGLPTEALADGQRTELAEDDRVYLGAWTRIVVRKATVAESHLGH